MFGTLMAITSGALGVAAITIVALLAWSIRREDAAKTLAGRPANPADGFARSLMDVHLSGIVSAHEAPQKRFTVRGRIHVHDDHVAHRPQHAPRQYG